MRKIDAIQAPINLLDRYDHVKKKKSRAIKGKRYEVYVGKIKSQYGGGREEFTVDTQEVFELNLPEGRAISMPSHIDIQLGGNKHRRENIPWEKFLRTHENLLEKYGVTSSYMLKNLKHQK